MKRNDKQSAVCNLILTRLIRRRMGSRPVCVSSDTWRGTTPRQTWGVFVGEPEGSRLQPLYVSGASALEVARKMLTAIETMAQEIEKATTQSIAA